MLGHVVILLMFICGVMVVLSAALNVTKPGGGE